MRSYSFSAMEMMKEELEADAREEQDFRKASKLEKFFFFWRNCFDAKKYCMMSLLLSLILLVQILSLLPLTDLAKTENSDLLMTAWKKYFGRVLKNCLVAPNGTLDEF